ncbi:MAG: TonB C-terminal domain-containing protein [Azoarcus sp.]|nr:TonB C-terminal domain-containing protein [Azoarcus sp.]
MARARTSPSADPAALAAYENLLRLHVRSRLIIPPGLQGNPQAMFKVTQLPNGDVSKVELLQSSGNAQLDIAIERAIQRASPLPLPEDKSLFKRELTITFRPLEAP